jgi:tRNA-dihydrouridine synthase B
MLETFLIGPSFLNSMVKLGRLHIENPFVLAPMSMYSDIGLRMLCYDYGCAYAFTEKISAGEFAAKTEGLKRKLDQFDNVGIQFMSNNPIELKAALKIISDCEFYKNLDNISSVDLNLGCPTPDIIAKNLGAGLLKKPILVRELFKTMNKNSPLPISAKIRLAVNSKHKKSKPYLRIAKIAEEENLDFITVHARTAGQLYSGDVDFSALQEIRDAVNIPLIGNGGIINDNAAEKMLDCCDAAMIGQSAIKNPFIFKELLHYHDTGTELELKIIDEKRKCITDYLMYAEKYNIGFQHVKIHMQGFLRGIPGYEDEINSLTHTRTIAEINKIIFSLKFMG